MRENWYTDKKQKKTKDVSDMERKKILLVEDEVKLARFVELELKYEGYDVTVCHDGR